MDPDRIYDPFKTITKIPIIRSKISIFPKTIDQYLAGSSENYKRNMLLQTLQRDPYNHPQDGLLGRVVIRNINIETLIPRYEEFEGVDAVLFVLNHSATANQKVTQAIRDICVKRAAEGRPLTAFAVTENGEPRKWDTIYGLYPSGKLLRDYVILLPSHIKPTIVKLWAAFYDEKFQPRNKSIKDIIAFITTNFEGELAFDIRNSENVQRVLENIYNH